VNTLNRGKAISAGKHIATIDGDDLAMNFRFEKQVQFLAEQSDYGLLGTWMERFGERKTTWRYPTGDTAMRLAVLIDNPIGHPSVMFRRGWDHGGPGYNDEAFAYAEDFEYRFRISALWKCENLPEALTL